MNRRTLLHGSFVLGAGALFGTQLAGCSAPAPSSSGSSASEGATAQSDDTAEPAATAGVSGLGSTVDDYTRLCPGATIGDGLAVRGEEVADARGDVEAWLRRIGLLVT
jgi:hypothetical protein